MLGFAVGRLMQAIVVMLVVALLSFSLFRFVGDPVNMMVGIETSIQEREAELLRAIADTLDCPIPPFVDIAES